MNRQKTTAELLSELAQLLDEQSTDRRALGAAEAMAGVVEATLL